MKASLLLLCAVCLPIALAARASPDPSTGTIQGRVPTIDDWVPRTWWRPVETVAGDLDGDGLEDMAVILQRPDEALDDPKWPPGSRALLVLFKGSDGRWRRGPLVPGLLPCVGCIASLSGTTESAIVDFQITPDGILEIGWVHRRHTTKAVRFHIGWDKTYGRLGLLADDVTVINPYGGRSRVRRDYRAGTVWVDGEPSSMPSRFIPIEEVSAAAY